MAVSQRIRDDATAADAALAKLAAVGQPMAPTNDGLPDNPMIGGQPPVENTEPGVPQANVTTVEQTTPPALNAPDLSLLEQQLAREKQRYQSLAGRSEQQASQIAELNGKISMLQQLVAAKANPEPTPTTRPSIIKDEWRKDYGDEFLEVAATASREQWQPLYDSLLLRVEKMEREMGSVQQATQQTSQHVQRSSFDQYLDRLDNVPSMAGWRQINEDPDFLSWLNERDPLSQAVRGDLLTAAFQSYDVARTVLIFGQYMQETGKAPTVPAADAAPSTGQPRIDPATLVAPGNAAPAPQSTRGGNKGKVWTAKEVAAVYDNKMKGKMTQEAFAKAEAEITQAYLEGRIKD